MIRFDRTPFYLEMARLEKQARLVTGVSDKIKMTVAEMLISLNRSYTEKDGDS